jgi:hypothetical protein
MQLVIAASPLRTQQVEADIDWLRRKILKMGQIGWDKFDIGQIDQTPIAHFVLIH